MSNAKLANENICNLGRSAIKLITCTLSYRMTLP